MNPDHVTIHNTANGARKASAAMHAKYLLGESARKRKVSWHYTVDDSQAIKHLPVFEEGMHAGTREGNGRSVGIEICEFRGIDQEAANDRAALLTAVLLFVMQLPISTVVPHRYWSGKNCPHLLLADGEKGWRAFIRQVERFLTELEGAGK
jgi:N-acetylmuramoyl-L-alanine amidase